MPRFAPVGLIAAFVLVSAGCGANPTPSEDVADAGARTKAAGTARVETVSRISLASNGESHEYRTTGVVDYSNDRSEYRDESDGCREIMIGDASYSEYAPLEDGLPAGKRWVKFEYDAADSEALYEQSLEPTTGEHGMTSYGIALSTSGPEQPDGYLDYLRETSGEPELVGTEDVRGVSTTRYHATVDVRSSTRKAFEAQGWKARNIERVLEGVQGVREIDVWVDSDGLVRRIVAADSSEGADGAVAAEWLTTTEYFDFGLDAEIQAPPAAEVMDAETWQLAQEKAMSEWQDEHAMEMAEEGESLPGGFDPSPSADSDQSPPCMP